MHARPFWWSSWGYNHMVNACRAQIVFDDMVGIAQPADSQVGLSQEVTHSGSFDACFREQFAPAHFLVVESLVHDFRSQGQRQYDGVAYQCDMWMGIFLP